MLKDRNGQVRVLRRSRHFSQTNTECSDTSVSIPTASCDSYIMRHPPRQCIPQPQAYPEILRGQLQLRLLAIDGLVLSYSATPEPRAYDVDTGVGVGEISASKFGPSEDLKFFGPEI